MPEDFSRVRDNPLLNYSGVELKQGAVLLDADMNEFVAITDRRIRALASDVLGRVTVSSTTPDAFKITTGGSSFEIGKGRLYVDGLLAENHGQRRSNEEPAQPLEFDPLMGEPTFGIEPVVTYETQPYLPNPPDLPKPGQHIVYLDVWQRAVTHIEDPNLVEIAVGVETSSRLQIVWQVRVLGLGREPLTCDSEVDEWNELTAPSTGRLTTGTYEETAVEDPCELPPTGGFRGLENQLYRVEIHESGALGKATFKWSRDDASRGSRVTSMISAKELELNTLGRDDLMRLKSGDWVEIIDDIREFSQLPGEMRKITVDDDGAQRIRFVDELPNKMLPQPITFPNTTHPVKSNLRVRRWDQQGVVRRATGSGNTDPFQDLNVVDSPGTITIPDDGSALLLENGITVSFTSVGDKGFQTGDYWVFAARTADASVELLKDAPPRGIDHHYARLAILSISPQGDDVRGGDIITDCRHSWPPDGGAAEDCACTQCVTPKSHASGEFTIQDAVDKANDTGGTVCLSAGEYVLASPVTIQTRLRPLRIKGQGLATKIVRSPVRREAVDGEAFIVGGVGIGIEDLGIFSINTAPAIRVKSVMGLTLQKLTIVKGPDKPSVLPIVRGTTGMGIALGGFVAGGLIRENLIRASQGIGVVGDHVFGATAMIPSLSTVAVAIEKNAFLCHDAAISLTNSIHFGALQIRSNEIIGCNVAGISLMGIAGGTAGDLSVPSAVMISENSVHVGGSGIVCALDGVWIKDNKLSAKLPSPDTKNSGIAIVKGLDKKGIDQCYVLANQISGFPASGILIEATIRDLIVKLNIIQECGNGIVMTPVSEAGAISVENNHLRAIGQPKADAAVGIQLANAETASVIGNAIRDVGINVGAVASGIRSLGVTRARITGNEISGLGAGGDSGAAIGIYVRGPFGDVHVAHNRVTPTDARTGAWNALRISERPFRVELDDGDEGAIMDVNAGTLLVTGRFARRFPARVNGQVEKLAGASVVDNILSGTHKQTMADVSVRGNVMFANNRCGSSTPSQNLADPAVGIKAGAAVVTSNQVLGGKVSIALNVKPGHFTILGNITQSKIRVDDIDLAGPWDAFNVKLST